MRLGGTLAGWVAAFLLAGASLLAQNSLLEPLRLDMTDGRLDDFPLIDTAFILSGAQEPARLDSCLAWYHALLNELRTLHDPHDRTASALRIFSHLHATRLKTYVKEATTLLDIVRHRTFNCVSATILYNLLCEELDMRTEAFETPTHVYTLFSDFSRRLMVENTTPMGFDILRNLRAYTRHLAHYYPESEVLKIGLDRLYLHDNSRGRPISNTELLGLLAYNRAWFAARDQAYEAAYDWILLAQAFNPDSRSNLRFEAGLYQRWGAILAQNQNYRDAFTVFADGAYRFPEDEKLSKNCVAAFFMAARQDGRQQDWNSFRQRCYEMLDLNILTPNDLNRLEKMIIGWKTTAETSKQPWFEETEALEKRIQKLQDS